MTTPTFRMQPPSFLSEEGIERYYGWRARGYDKVTAYEVEHHREAIGLADIRLDDQVLEVACGTGRATLELASRFGPSGRVDALDISDAMLMQAQSKLAELSLIDRVRLRHGRAQELPFPDRTFDLLYNAYMFDLVPEEQFGVILHEFARVLKPGGRMVLVNMSKESSKLTLYERVYAMARRFPCRPVALESFVLQAGFAEIRRAYRKSYTYSLQLPFGTEIVTARKPCGG